MYFDVDVASMVEQPSSVPLRNSPDELYQQFIEIQKLDVEDQEQLAHEFENITQVHLQVLMNLKARRSLPEDDSKICKKLEVMLREEKNTWRLTKALLKDQLFNDPVDESQSSDRMDDSGNHQQVVTMKPGLSEEQVIGHLYYTNSEIRRMQAVADWLELNAADELQYKDQEDQVEFYSEGPTAWENTFHAMRAEYATPNTGLELCSAMDPDAPIRTKKSLVHSDKEVEIRLYKHLFRFLRAGKLDEGQELAQRVGYHWLSATLDGWLPYSDPNLEDENHGSGALHQPVSGNKKRNIWKQTCFKTSKVHGLTSCEKAILGVLGGNLKSVLPVCNQWSDQLWARLKCSIEVRIERSLGRDNYPQEFYDNQQDIRSVFKSIEKLKILSPFKEETIHQAVQKYLILNDINNLLEQLQDWCNNLEYDNDLAENSGAISPHFLRFFAHIVLFLRENKLVTANDPRGSKIIESYISLLIQQKSIESVAHYTVFLPLENQILSFAKLLATINNREERKLCLEIAIKSRLDVGEITQTVVELIRDEPTKTSDLESNKTTAVDKRKIDALDYLLFLESKNYLAILHHGLILLRYFALHRKLDAVKETFLKLPNNLRAHVEKQWTLHTNNDITPSLNNNLRELDCFRVLLEAQDKLSLWSEWHHKKPEAPKKPTNLSRFCDNVNYDQALEQFHHETKYWEAERESRTNELASKIEELFKFPGGWMLDLATHEPPNDERLQQLKRLRKIFVPQMTTICFNVLHLTNRYEDCLKVSHLLAQEDLKLHEEFTKDQLRDFLDKISEVTKIYVKTLSLDAK